VSAWLQDYPICDELMKRNVAYVSDTCVAYDDRSGAITAVGAAGTAAHPTLGAVFALLAP
jgi:hypothetical protein